MVCMAGLHMQRAPLSYAIDVLAGIGHLRWSDDE